MGRGTGSKGKEEDSEGEGSHQGGSEEAKAWQGNQLDFNLGRALKSLLSWGGKGKRFGQHIDQEGWACILDIAKELKTGCDHVRKLCALGEGRFHI